MPLPPGQRAVEGFPRFGADLRRPPPPVPDGLTIEVTGPLCRRVAFRPAELAALPRRSIEADFHCVAGWSTEGLRWDGVRFADAYERLIEPALLADARVRYVVFVGLDGYRSIVTIEDARRDTVLLADRLAGAALTPEHGGPVRVVSPEQYGYVSTKHLCRIELYAFEPVNVFHPHRAVQRALLAVRPHPRARVAHEERHRYLPSRLARWIYRATRLPAPEKRPD